MAGDYNKYQMCYSSRNANASVLAADTATVEIIDVTKSVNHRLYIQKITVSVTTDAAQSLTFQDEAGTPVLDAKTKASPGLGPIVFDFGPQGYPLTLGKGLDMVISGAGLAATVHIEAYEKLEGAVAMASTN